MKAARLPKGFAAFYQNYARAEILLACYHSLLESPHKPHDVVRIYH
jgi:hypothetical protein